MISWSKPSQNVVDEVLSKQKDAQLTYAEVGMTKNSDAEVPGYIRDHNRVRLGTGVLAFVAAVEALKKWRHFTFGWVQIANGTPAIEEGNVVAVIANIATSWWLCTCRVVYTIEEDGPFRRFGFAYGTLPGHPESGEERFLIEWNKADDSVWYDIVAYSKPNDPLVSLGYPFARMAQRAFAKDSLRAMFLAVNTKSGCIRS